VRGTVHLLVACAAAPLFLSAEPPESLLCGAGTVSVRFCGFAMERESQYGDAELLPCHCSWGIESGSSFILNGDANRTFSVGSEAECLDPADLRTINQQV